MSQRRPATASEAMGAGVLAASVPLAILVTPFAPVPPTLGGVLSVYATGLLGGVVTGALSRVTTRAAARRGLAVGGVVGVAFGAVVVYAFLRDAGAFGAARAVNLWLVSAVHVPSRLVVDHGTALVVGLAAVNAVVFALAGAAGAALGERQGAALR